MNESKRSVLDSTNISRNTSEPNQGSQSEIVLLLEGREERPHACSVPMLVNKIFSNIQLSKLQSTLLTLCEHAAARVTVVVPCICLCVCLSVMLILAQCTVQHPAKGARGFN